MSKVTPITAAKQGKPFPDNLDTLEWADEEPEYTSAELLGYALIFIIIAAIIALLSAFVWALQ